MVTIPVTETLSTSIRTTGMVLPRSIFWAYPFGSGYPLYLFTPGRLRKPKAAMHVKRMSLLSLTHYQHQKKVTTNHLSNTEIICCYGIYNQFKEIRKSILFRRNNMILKSDFKKVVISDRNNTNISTDLRDC